MNWFNINDIKRMVNFIVLKIQVERTSQWAVHEPIDS
jgi:hypothetical protein